MVTLWLIRILWNRRLRSRRPWVPTGAEIGSGQSSRFGQHLPDTFGLPQALKLFFSRKYRFLLWDVSLRNDYFVWRAQDAVYRTLIVLEILVAHCRPDDVRRVHSRSQSTLHVKVVPGPRRALEIRRTIQSMLGEGDRKPLAEKASDHHR